MARNGLPLKSVSSAERPDFGTLDRARPEWLRRVEAFLAERDAIDTDPALPPQERERRQRRLLDPSCSATEQLCLRAPETGTIRGDRLPQGTAAGIRSEP